VSGNFSTTVVGDFEYEVADDELPNVLCMVAYVLDENLRDVRTIKMWRGDFGGTPPFDIGDDTLFVAYSAWAEMTCFLTLGWKFPKHIFDQHTAYLAASNWLLPHDPDEPRKRERKRLSDACRAYGIQGWENIDKEEIAKAIGEGRWREYGRERVFEYCEEDVRKSVQLLRAQLRDHARLPRADVMRVLHWSLAWIKQQPAWRRAAPRWSRKSHLTRDGLQTCQCRPASAAPRHRRRSDRPRAPAPCDQSARRAGTFDDEVAPVFIIYDCRLGD